MEKIRRNGGEDRREEVVSGRDMCEYCHKEEDNKHVDDDDDD